MNPEQPLCRINQLGISFACSVHSCAENYVCCSIIENLTNPVDPPLPGETTNNGGNNGNGGGTGSGGDNGGINSGGTNGGGTIGGGTIGGGTNGGSTGEGSITQPNRPSANRNCTCVPPEQCYRDPEEATSGVNDIDIK